MERKCENCRNWRLTNPEVKVGLCIVRSIKTFNYAGLIYSTPKHYKFCSYYVNKP